MTAVAESRPLYGGDLMIISQLLQSLAHRLRQSLTKINDLELRENLVTQLMENVQRTASYLLDDFQVQSCDEDSLKILGEGRLILDP